MIRVRIVTEIIVIALKLLGLAKRLHPKLFATFRAVLAEAINPSNLTPDAVDGVPPQESGDLTPPDVHAKMWRLRQSRRH
jgi:hypothetical protein